MHREGQRNGARQHNSEGQLQFMYMYKPRQSSAEEHTFWQRSEWSMQIMHSVGQRNGARQHNSEGQLQFMYMYKPRQSSAEEHTFWQRSEWSMQIMHSVGQRNGARRHYSSLLLGSAPHACYMYMSAIAKNLDWLHWEQCMEFRQMIDMCVMYLCFSIRHMSLVNEVNLRGKIRNSS